MAPSHCDQHKDEIDYNNSFYKENKFLINIETKNY